MYIHEFKCQTYLEYVGLLGCELRDLEAIVPLPVPTDDASVQQQWLSHNTVPPSLFLEKDQCSLSASSLTREPRTRDENRILGNEKRLKL